MVSSLFDPWTAKSFFDLLTLGMMALQIILFLMLPVHVKRGLFLVIFLAWRSSYNIGLGYLLKWQSEKKGLVMWAKRKGWFDERKNPKVYRWLRRELSVKMGPDYHYEVCRQLGLPIEPTRGPGQSYYNQYTIFAIVFSLAKCHCIFKL